uniref:Uncharacterized protein n=1 Tax=Globodera rostochiensis TaxID=31243 RepID=A0A914HTC4_GLORO
MHFLNSKNKCSNNCISTNLRNAVLFVLLHIFLEKRGIPTIPGQHKRPEYFLYTSGCLNLTRPDLAMLRAQIPVQNGATNDAKSLGNETQLCEAFNYLF